MGAFVKPLARIIRHGFQFLLTAVRAGEQGFQYGLECRHGQVCLEAISCSILSTISSTEMVV